MRVTNSRRLIGFPKTRKFLSQLRAITFPQVTCDWSLMSGWGQTLERKSLTLIRSPRRQWQAAKAAP